MEFALKPDYERVKERYNAFWQGEIIDRPPVSIVLPHSHPTPVPCKQYENEYQRWTDVDFRAEQLAVQVANYEYYADSLPIVWPNMGPEIFSAWCGCDYEFGETTAWSKPCIHDWERDEQKAVFNPEHPLFQMTVDFTKKLLEYAKGQFIVGLTDFHPGGDHLAALRDPQTLALDLIENLDWVKLKLESSMKEFFHVYNIFYDMLRNAGMPITSWAPLIHDGPFYIVSNDFSCMISKKMFDSIFLPGISEECRYYERSIYHLDGPGALHHLDALLEIKELDAIQWVCGAGNEGYARWVPVYQKIQKAKKSIQLSITLDELPLVFETLKPEGVWFSHIEGIRTKDVADLVIKRISQWK